MGDNTEKLVWGLSRRTIAHMMPRWIDELVGRVLSFMSRGGSRSGDRVRGGVIEGRQTDAARWTPICPYVIPRFHCVFHLIIR